MCVLAAMRGKCTLYTTRVAFTALSSLVCVGGDGALFVVMVVAMDPLGSFNRRGPTEITCLHYRDRLESVQWHWQELVMPIN